jgi:pimeloyl-ACP methyl ester carboxylesterase
MLAAGGGASAAPRPAEYEPTSLEWRAAGRRWVRLIRRICEVDPMVCPRCGGTMRILAFLTEPRVIEKTLRHLAHRGVDARMAHRLVSRVPDHPDSSQVCPDWPRSRLNRGYNPPQVRKEIRRHLEQPTTVAGLPGGAVEYRLDRRGRAVVLVFHGGHTRAGLALGEDVFAAAWCTLLAPSRPGYGRTPPSTGGSVEGYTDVVRSLCAELGITRVAAVVGISAGRRTAATMAARHADLVERLILVSAVSWLPYPDRWTRLGARLAFASWSEPGTWGAIRTLLRIAPDVCLRLMLASLSTRPPGEVVAGLRPEDRALLLALFASMRSGRGFLTDLRPTPDVTARIVQPTLVIATRTDGGVPFAHAQSLVDTIRHAELVESRADSHLVWLGPDWPAIADRIRVFLNADPTAARAAHLRA